MKITKEQFASMSVIERENFIRGSKIKELIEMDGTVFINIDANAETELGKFLSTFVQTPFTHPHYDYFASMDAFWYWLSSGPSGGRDDSIRPLFGRAASIAGRRCEWTKVDNFYGEIIFATYVKINAYREMAEALMASELPFVMYYQGGSRDVDIELRIPRITPNRRWLVAGVEDIRSHFKKNDIFTPYAVPSYLRKM